MISPLGLESLGFDPQPHSGRLSGLLSGCPPTGTRPQARAKLGNRELSAMHHRCKSFFALARIFLVARGTMVTQTLSTRPASRSRFVWTRCGSDLEVRRS